MSIVIDDAIGAYYCLVMVKSILLMFGSAQAGLSFESLDESPLPIMPTVSSVPSTSH